MNKHFLTLLSALGIALVASFCWGFAGFVSAGSGGPPSSERLFAFWAGGIGYLVFLLVASTLSSGAPSGIVMREFCRGNKRNLKGTVIALLACFPAAFFFIGFLLPPVILCGSVLILLFDSIRLRRLSAESAGEDLAPSDCLEVATVVMSLLTTYKIKAEKGNSTCPLCNQQIAVKVESSSKTIRLDCSCGACCGTYQIADR